MLLYSLPLEEIASKIFLSKMCCQDQEEKINIHCTGMVLIVLDYKHYEYYKLRMLWHCIQPGSLQEGRDPCDLQWGPFTLGYCSRDPEALQWRPRGSAVGRQWALQDGPLGLAVGILMHCSGDRGSLQ